MTGVVFCLSSPSGIGIKDADLYIFDSEGKTLIGQLHGEKGCTELAMPELPRGTSYLIAACANSDLGEIADSASADDLSPLSISIDSVSTASWREEQAWPLVLKGEKPGFLTVTVPGNEPGNGIPSIDLCLQPFGQEVGIRIDATGVNGYDVEILDVYMTSNGGEAHPFAGLFLENRLQASQRPSLKESALLQDALRSARQSPPCSFYVLDGLEESDSRICAKLRFHGRSDGTDRTYVYSHKVSSSLPEGLDPSREHADFILDLEENGSGVSGIWTSVKARDEETVTLTFNAPAEGIHTKADDSSVGRLDIWVCPGGGNPQYFGHSDSQTVTITLPKATGYMVYAAANLPDGILNYGNLNDCLGADLQTLSYNLSESGRGSIVLSGTKTGIDIAYDYQTVTIPVYRRAAKVTVGSIINSLEDPYSTSSVSLDGIYIINGRAVQGVFEDLPMGDLSHWFNCSGFYSPSAKDFGQSETPAISGTMFPSAKIIAHGATLNHGESYYTTRNSVTTDTYSALADVMASSSWTVRKTRLVLECTIGGSKCWYPVTLPAVSDNSHYYIESITLKHFGSTDPDIPISTDAAELVLKIKDWTNLSINEII